MTAAARVELLQQRLQPAIVGRDPALNVQREGVASAAAIGRVVALIDALLPALTVEAGATELVERWEAASSLPARPTDSLAERAARIRAVQWRRRGYTPAALVALIAPVAGVIPAQLAVIEVRRSQIDPQLTSARSWPASARSIPIGAVALEIQCDVPWPGVVDDTGVELEVDVDVASGADLAVELRHEDGTRWTVAALGSLAGANPHVVATTRTAFRGRAACGPWTLIVKDPVGASGAAYLRRWSLRVSNSVDARAVYRLYIVRDPATGATVGLEESQRLMDLAAVGHVWARVCERSAMLCDDPHSQCDRDPIGS